MPPDMRYGLALSSLNSDSSNRTPFQFMWTTKAQSISLSIQFITSAPSTSISNTILFVSALKTFLWGWYKSPPMRTFLTFSQKIYPMQSIPYSQENSVFSPRIDCLASGSVESRCCTSITFMCSLFLRRSSYLCSLVQTMVFVLPSDLLLFLLYIDLFSIARILITRILTRFGHCVD